MTDPLRDTSEGSKLDRILGILSRRQRRLILVTLRQSGPIHQSDVLLRGPDAEDAEVPLHHVHLPKLEETGYIEWDRETGMLSEGPRFDEIAPIIDLMETYADELPHNWP